jgi:hypothetical protein
MKTLVWNVEVWKLRLGESAWGPGGLAWLLVLLGCGNARLSSDVGIHNLKVIEFP